jgi:ATP/maltotriose-dependent transcriptional regulator MalT
VTVHSNDAFPAEPRPFLSPIEPGFGVDTRPITDRQLECLAWVQQGKSATDIGGILGLSGRTVEKHIIKVCGHLGVKTRIQAVVRARELGLITGNAA